MGFRFAVVAFYGKPGRFMYSSKARVRMWGIAFHDPVSITSSSSFSENNYDDCGRFVVFKIHQLVDPTVDELLGFFALYFCLSLSLSFLKGNTLAVSPCQQEPFTDRRQTPSDSNVAGPSVIRAYKSQQLTAPCGFSNTAANAQQLGAVSSPW